MDDASVREYLAALPASEAAQVRGRLDALRTDCGCAVGAIVMLGVTASWIAHALLVPTPGRSWQRTVALGFGVMVASMLAGKLMGLALARVRLRLELRRLRQAFMRGRGK